MSNLFAELTNLFDQDFMSIEEGKPILDWLNKHKEDINDIERSCLNDFNQLKQQLEEKDNLIEFGREEIRKRNKRIDEIVERDKKLFDEKNKEIERLKQQNTLLENENGKLAKELIVKNYKKAQKEVSFGIQLAIQELEKVKAKLKDKIKMMSNEEHCYQRKVVSWFDICDQINMQIKELKGE